MANISRFLTFGLQLSVCRALSCSSPFTDILGVCLYFDPNILKTWCDAQAYCSSVEGELVRGYSFLPLNGNAFSGLPENYWIGLTDFLTERNTSRAGWRWRGGSLEPLSSNLAWLKGQPNLASQDCVRQCLSFDRLCNSNCLWKFAFLCQPRSLPSSAARAAEFQAVAIPAGLPADDFAEGGGCSKLLKNVEAAIDCFALCKIEPKEWCVSFYFNQEKKQCRLVLYTDATVDMGDAQGWKKFVIKK